MTKQTKAAGAVAEPVENAGPKRSIDPDKIPVPVGTMQIVAKDIVTQSGGGAEYPGCSSHDYGFVIERRGPDAWERIVGDELEKMLAAPPEWLVGELSRRKWEIVAEIPVTKDGVIRFGQRNW